MTAGDPVRIPLPPQVRLVDAGSGLPRLEVSADTASAHVYVHGAQLTHWQPAATREPVLWLSAYSQFREGKAIRGGIPICYPWFGPHAATPAAPAHGYARLAEWRLTRAIVGVNGIVDLAFTLETDEATSPYWPHRSRVTYAISIGASLSMTLEVENASAEPFTYEEALHTYFAVSDIGRVAIEGLEETEYLDKVDSFARKRQGSEPIRFSGETDRVFLNTSAECRIADEGWSRTIVVGKSGSRSTVVWNPWAERARTFADFGDDEWRGMVCVETANVGDARVRLEPGASHVLRAEIRVR